MEVYFIRHAQSEANLHPEIIGGRTNNSLLSVLGVRQAHSLGERFARENEYFDQVYSSPAIRTLETARISLDYINFQFEDAVILDELQELDQGEWTGRKRVEVYTPEVTCDMEKLNWNFKAPNGESQKEVGDRMMNWLNNYITPLNSNCLVALYGHGMAIRCMLANLFDYERSTVWKIPLENTAITKLKFENGVWVPPRDINDYSHLENIS